MIPLFLPKPRNLQKPGWCILFRRPVLSTFPSGSIHRLGGWTQTSVTPSPLCRQEFEEQRRLLRNLCFRCGGSHFASTCSKSIRGVEYKCPSCSSRLMISSRGQSVSVQKATRQPAEPSVAVCAWPFSAGSLQPPALSQIKEKVAAPPPRLCPAKHHGPAAPSDRPRNAIKRCDHAGKVVSIDGQYYSPLSWFIWGPESVAVLLRQSEEELCSCNIEWW